MNKNSKIKSVMTAVLALTAISLNVNAATTATTAASSNQNTEKCFGIVKAGMNDCAAGKSSCAGSSKKDKQGDSYIFLPKGTCNKIVGGSLTAITDDKAK